MCFHLNISSSPCPWQPFGSLKPVVGQAALAKLVYTAARLNDNRRIIDSKIISLRPQCLVSKQHQDDTANELVAHDSVGHQWHGDRLFGRKALFAHTFIHSVETISYLLCGKDKNTTSPPSSILSPSLLYFLKFRSGPE